MNRTIHLSDSMFVEGGEDHYFRVGESALSCIKESIQSSIGPLPSSRYGHTRILDYAAGFGRVTRHLTRHVPNAIIEVFDKNAEACQFCLEELGTPYYCSSLSENLSALGKEYDLIWCGSLITHFDKRRIKRLLTDFWGSLALGGICVFTTHGEYSYQSLKNKSRNYDLPEGPQLDLIANYEESGYAYRDYPSEKEYGVSLTSFDWIHTVAGCLPWKLTYFKQQAWDDHQDVYCYQKVK